MKKSIIFAAALVTVFGAKGAFAQTATASVGGTVEQSLFISLDNTSLSFSAANAAAFNAGRVDVTAGNLIHKGNVAHSVSVKAGTTSMKAATLNGRQDKPSSDVLFSVAGYNTGAFTPLSSTGTTIVTSAAAGDYSKALQYRMLLNWANDKPDTYSVDVVYTITAG